MTRPAPTGVRSLDGRIRQEAAGRPELLVRTAVATTVLAQMLPPGVVKGGTAMKLRFGPDQTRYSRDVDVARADALDTFIADLKDALVTGWGGFGGTVRETKADPRPVGVPDDYVMQPYDVKLTYRGTSWCTVPLEIGHDEIGDTAETDLRIADDLVDLFRRLGLPDPAPVPVLAVHHQVAQKLHACTAPGSERAHDLVDLQLLDHDEPIDPAATKDAATRLFRFRQGHGWPPTVAAGPGWDTLYAEAADGIGVLPDIDDAIVWTNELIDRIDAAT